MKQRRSVVASSCCSARVGPWTRIVYKSTIHGASNTPSAVITTRATTETVTIALVAASL